MVRRALAIGGISVSMVAAVFACTGDEEPAIEGVRINEAGADVSAIVDQDVFTPPSDDGGRELDAALDVRAIPNLRLWLEASLGVAKDSDNNVSAWSDSSGRWDGGADGGPDGGVHRALLRPADGGSPKPRWLDSDIGGRPAVKTWGGSDDVPYYLGIANHPDFAAGRADWLVAGVAKLGQGSGAGQIMKLMSTTTGDVHGIEITAGGLCVTHSAELLTDTSACTAPAKNLTQDEAHTFVARRVGAQIIYRVDGTVHGTFTLPDNPDLTVTFAQSKIFAIGNGQTMELSELMEVIGPMTEDDALAIETYLHAKYSIPYRD